MKRVEEYGITIQHQAEAVDLSASSCSASPTGAHHWVLGMPSQAVAAACKHCHMQREFHPYDAENNRGYGGRPKGRDASPPIGGANEGSVQGTGR